MTESWGTHSIFSRPFMEWTLKIQSQKSRSSLYQALWPHHLRCMRMRWKMRERVGEWEWVGWGVTEQLWSVEDLDINSVDVSNLDLVKGLLLRPSPFPLLLFVQQIWAKFWLKVQFNMVNYLILVLVSIVFSQIFYKKP